MLWLSPSTMWGEKHVGLALCPKCMMMDPGTAAHLKSLMWPIRILGPGSGLLGHSAVQSRCNLYSSHWLSTACWWIALPRSLTLWRWGTLISFHFKHLKVKSSYVGACMHRDFDVWYQSCEMWSVFEKLSLFRKCLSTFLRLALSVKQLSLCLLKWGRTTWFGLQVTVW